MSVKELIDYLNHSDECNFIEAKRGSAIDRSILESVCSMSNEPGLGGGYILLGVLEETQSLFPSFVVEGVENPDKLQRDISTQCASMFNISIRPKVDVELFGDKNVIKIFVPEVSEGQKPVYFKNEGLPRGAYRRIGSTDQRCTDDDLLIFYKKEETFDSTLVQDADWHDISEESIDLYRNLRSKVNPYAEELQYSNEDLQYSLGCSKKINSAYLPTYAGLLLFGSRMAHRRLLPMVRVDYIRVPGNEWIADPENRFTTIDMRGSLLEMVQRVFSQITDDLPKGFLLPEGELQAESVGLPTRVLREAIVNALIHRSYRENQPIQIIRYGNRLEIKNPGFSLKPEDHLGEPGSKNRNPNIAAVFHETNLAETKGSGIKTMRTLMEKANLLPPTFESDHGRNMFTTRLFLHHFLGVSDIKWLGSFDQFELNQNQKRGLILLKEMGALDNSSYRQTNNVDTLKASVELRDLSKKEILLQKGKGRSTYYVPGKNFSAPPQQLSAPPRESEPVQLESEPVQLESEPVSLESKPTRDRLVNQLPSSIKEKLAEFTGRTSDRVALQDFICELCSVRELSAKQLSLLLTKQEKYLLHNFIKPLREEGKIEYTIPEMPNHPQQAYKTKKTPTQ
ncbi:MAG: ATP-binding protein [Flavobacteriaceae bacterium]